MYKFHEEKLTCNKFHEQKLARYKSHKKINTQHVPWTKSVSRGQKSI